MCVGGGCLELQGRRGGWGLFLQTFLEAPFPSLGPTLWLGNLREVWPQLISSRPTSAELALHLFCLIPLNSHL